MLPPREGVNVVRQRWFRVSETAPPIEAVGGIVAGLGLQDRIEEPAKLKAGGDVVCSLKADVRDSQGQGTVGVDAAKQLVDIGHVPVIIGSIISSVTLPILTSVTAPAKVVQIAPVSSSPTFTILAKEGKTNGVFFRTIPDDTLQGVALAKLAIDQKMARLTVLNVNNDYGVNLVKQFRAAYKALGGTVLSDTPYNEKQPSYQAEVTQALAAKPEALRRRHRSDSVRRQRRHHGAVPRVAHQGREGRQHGRDLDCGGRCNQGEDSAVTCRPASDHCNRTSALAFPLVQTALNAEAVSNPWHISRIADASHGLGHEVIARERLAN
jgi:substrate-binding family protein